MVAYHFGSSVGSSKKDEAISNALGNQQPPINVANVENVNTGSAAPLNEWKPGAYKIGDKVTYLGVTYEALANTLLSGVVPGDDAERWKVV